MGINPFRDTNFNDLQENLGHFLSDHTDTLRKRVSEWIRDVRRRGNERITLMFIPHSEKKIINFHISVFSIVITSAIFVTVTIVTSLLILNHTSNVKEVDRLKLYGSDYKEQIGYYREEVSRLYDVFSRFKPELAYLYSLTPDNYADSLWAKGGVTAPSYQQEGAAYPVETLNIQEIERDLKTSRDVLRKVKAFMENRSKIIENTPSLWPVNGHVVSAFGRRTSSFTNRQEFANGVDIAAFPGSEIRVSAPGTVESIVWDSFYGLRVAVTHKYGFTTVYSHCQRVSVEPGQKVIKGEVIGYVGRTGKATRHITHYQIRIGTEYVDPVPYLNRLTFDSEL